jgi:hypothetical protein
VPSKLIRGELSHFDVGYICGLIDGEGCIGVSRQKRKDSKDILRPYIHITNTNQEILSELKDAIGGSIQHQESHNPREKDVYTLRLFNTKLVSETLAKIGDKLKLKKKQAELVREFCQSRMNGAVEHGLGYSDRELELYEELRRLNKRGRA